MSKTLNAKIVKPRSQIKEFATMAVWISVIIFATAALRSWMTTDGTEAGKPKASNSELQ